ncbi:MAG: ATP-dependent protease [Burkholderiaceae bacterium]|nr:ATP-dependent protease [Burkholderiaceae bacterium]
MATVPLVADVLYRSTDPGQFSFRSTSELEDLPELIGQSRARTAIEFGVGIPHAGYNIFVAGPAGSGKQTLVRQLVGERARQSAPPSDWCYVHNFANPYKPSVIGLPAGLGRELHDQMVQAVEYLRNAIPALFASDEYRAKHDEIMKAFVERQEEAFKALAERARSLGVAFLRTPRGFAFVPEKDGEVLKPEDYEKLPEKDKDRLLETTSSLQTELEKILETIPHWWRERSESLKNLNRETLRSIVRQMLHGMRRRFSAYPPVLHYLDAVEEDMADHSESFRSAEEVPAEVHEHHAVETKSMQFMHRYRINVLVGNGEHAGAPIVAEENPTYANLMGRIEHISEMGTLVTNFTLIKPGALHRANGGYLLLDIRKLLIHPFSWEGLKRALRSREIRIESLPQMVGLVSTVSLEPAPIPMEVKVILFGDRIFYYLLCEYDPDFAELFKVAADFDDRVVRDAASNKLYAQMLASMARQHGLTHLDPAGVARVIDYGARAIGDAERLTTHARSVLDLLQEADFIARAAGAHVISAPHVQQAVDAQIYRLDRVRNRLQEEILRGTLLIDTTSSVVGQINGLSVIQLGGFAFGQPVRITARSRFGSGEMINIEREADLSGALHSKGVLILAGFLATRFAKSQPFALTASLVFEQSYARVDGDSASLAELCALMSDLASAPIHQSTAVTGSVNQMGEVQPIGGVNEKIEGFFDICSARGLDGRQGVVIPIGNVPHLMLKRQVVDAVRRSEFHVYAVRSVDEAMGLLTGLAAGEPNPAGVYPRRTINGRIADRIHRLGGMQKTYKRRTTEAVVLRHTGR